MHYPNFNNIRRLLKAIGKWQAEYNTCPQFSHSEEGNVYITEKQNALAK